MTKRDVLQKAIEMANHNVFCYSANYLMTEPKAGYEKEHKEAVEELQILESILQEVCGEKEKPAEDKPADGSEAYLKSKQILSGLLERYGDTQKLSEVLNIARSSLMVHLKHREVEHVTKKVLAIAI